MEFQSTGALNFNKFQLPEPFTPHNRLIISLFMKHRFRRVKSANKKKLLWVKKEKPHLLPSCEASGKAPTVDVIHLWIPHRSVLYFASYFFFFFWWGCSLGAPAPLYFHQQKSHFPAAENFSIHRWVTGWRRQMVAVWRRRQQCKVSAWLGLLVLHGCTTHVAQGVEQWWCCVFGELILIHLDFIVVQKEV